MRTVVKRDGRREPFDASKIVNAVRTCYEAGLGEDDDGVADAVVDRVVNTLAASRSYEPGVEDLQRLVIQQLWALGEFEAAEQYTRYREQRRQLRDTVAIDQRTVAAIEEDAARFPSQLQAYQFYSKFARWREEDRRRETWTECVDRVFRWFATIPQWSELTAHETSWLRESMFEFKSSPAMRVVQMAGPALERCHIGVYNCSGHPIVDLFAFAELLYILMQGSGGAFSVEQEYISELPRVKPQRKELKRKHSTDDSTEGWCNALLFGLEAWFDGYDVEYDHTAIRQKNARLKTKGGRASGPDTLRDLLDFVRNIVLRAQGRRLLDIEVHDICCKIGRVSGVGGMRRAALMSMSDLRSVSMRECKHGDWFLANGQRGMANNSAVYEEKPPIEIFTEEWLALMKSRSGERGIFNRGGARRNRPARRKDANFIVNACGEIQFRPFGLCNLTISIARGTETMTELADRVRAATYFGVLQSCCTKFRYVRDTWRINAEDERLLGVDIMGHLDHALLRPSAPNRAEHVRYLKAVVADTATELATRFSINRSAADTCLKPGGDSSVFFDTTSLMPYFSQYQLRLTRETVDSPIAAMLKDQGVLCEPAIEDEKGLVALTWPKKNRDGCITRDDMTALEQLENWLFWKRNWCEHSASATIFVKDDEWLKVGAWVYEHFDDVSSLAFLPYDNGSYRTAPNQAITKEQYEELAATFPVIDWSKLIRYEKEDSTVASQTPACGGGLCDI